jgi:lipoprotein NlpI
MFSWAFLQPLDFWIPLTFISFAIDYHFWNLNPVGYHLTNILLHAINTSLVVFLTDALLRDRFANIGIRNGMTSLYPRLLLFSGLFFGIHPLHVESVAWVTERKDVLNGVFCFSSLLFYLKYARLKESGERCRLVFRYYLLSIILFGLSLLAKSSSVVIPAILLIADYYPLGRMRKGVLTRLITEKMPYLLLSLIVSAVTLSLGSKKQILLSYDYIPLVERITTSGNALFEYCRLFIYPVGIIPFYQLPNELPFAFVIKTTLVLVVTVMCVFWAKRRPLVFAAWFSFVILFLPVLAFFQNGSQMLAARYTYLPSLVPGILVAASMSFLYSRLVDKNYLRRVVTILVTAVLLFYTGMTLNLITVWDNTEKLWSRVIEIKPIGMAYKDRGMFYLMHGRFDAAIADFTAAIEDEEIMKYIYSFNFFAFRGLAFERSGRFEESINDFTTALDSRPYPHYYLHRGRNLMMLGRKKEALEDFLRAGQVTGPMVWLDK